MSAERLVKLLELPSVSGHAGKLAMDLDLRWKSSCHVLPWRRKVAWPADRYP